MEQEKSHHCYGCLYYAPYYIKGDTLFDRQDIGLCRKSKETVDKRGICEKYHAKYYPTRAKTSLEVRIDETIAIFLQLKQLVQEEFEEARIFREEEREEFCKREETRKQMRKCPHAKNGECPVRKK